MCLVLWDICGEWQVSWTPTKSRRTNVSACYPVADPSCIGQSFVTTWFSMSSFFWTTIIAFHLFWTYDDSGKNVWKRNIVYHVSSWVVPFIITLVAKQMKVLGSDLSVGSGAWCWISACLSQKERTIWMTVSGKGWEILMYFASFAFYLLIKWRKIRKRQHQKKVINPNVRYRYTNLETTAHNDGNTHEDIRFLLLWLIEVALRMSGTIRFFIAAIQRHTDKKFLIYKPIDGILLHIQSFGDSAQAFCSFLLFCLLDKKTRELVKRYCSSRNREDSEIQELLSQSVNIST